MAKTPCKDRVSPTGLDPATALQMMLQAQEARFRLLTGQMPSAVETPQLGRIAYQPTTIADLQRLIDYLGVASGTRTGRVPFSFFGWP